MVVSGLMETRLYKLSMVIVLHLESFEDNLIESDFSISEKKRVSSVKPSQEDDFYEIFFLRFLLLFIYKNTSESIRLCFRKKLTLMSQQPQAA